MHNISYTLVKYMLWMHHKNRRPKHKCMNTSQYSG